MRKRLAVAATILVLLVSFAFMPSVSAGSAVHSTASRPPMPHVTISFISKANTPISTHNVILPRSPAPQSVGGTVYCLEVIIHSANALNTNVIQPKGEVYNGCSFTVTGITLELYGYVQCNGPSLGGSDSGKLPNLSSHASVN